MNLPSFVEPAGHGIFVIDTGYVRPRFDAAYLLVRDGRAAFVDTGTSFAVPRLLAALEALGLAPDAVDWVIPTHVHLDHAGGCGTLMRELPAARLLVHPRGARHLVDPAALIQGAVAVYGAEEVERSYGPIVGVAADRVTESSDGLQVPLGSSPLEVADTPGHARHHHCIWDGLSQSWFTGDTFGLSYPEFVHEGRSISLLTTTPVQFEPDALKASMARLLERQPQRMFVTHYGAVTQPQHHGRDMMRQVDDAVALGRSASPGAGRHEALKQGLAAQYLKNLRAHGCPMTDAQILDLLVMDIELNAQGLGVWLDKTSAAAATPPPTRS